MSLDNNEFFYRLVNNDSVTEKFAIDQGASFILDCLQILLESLGKQGPHYILCNEKPSSPAW